MRHILLRFVPRFDARWLVALLIVGVVVAATTYVRWGAPPGQLELVALGPDGQFHDELDMPADWADTMTATVDAVARFRMMLGVRNIGPGAARPARLVLGVPLRYRLTGPDGEQLPGRLDPATPLITYTLDLRMPALEPGRLPTMLPAYETLGLEPVIPRYYCVALAEAIPEFVPAPPPPLAAMREVRIFYAFEGGDMAQRQTGTFSVWLDTTLLAVTMPEQPPSFPMETDPELARPDLGPLAYVGSRTARCGEPEAPMELLSTVWETEAGARMITLDYGGQVRKHLFDLNGDGVIDRESWDPEGHGRFSATRRARLPTPEFLLPIPTAMAYDMARFDEIPSDSLARLDPMRRAMPGPGPLPIAADTPEIRVAPPVAAPAAPPAADTLPAPRIERRGPLGRPIQVDPVQRPPPDGDGR